MLFLLYRILSIFNDFILTVSKDMSVRCTVYLVIIPLGSSGGFQATNILVGPAGKALISAGLSGTNIYQSATVLYFLLFLYFSE